MKKLNNMLAIALTAASIAVMPAVALAAAPQATANDSALQPQVEKKLSNGHFKNVTVQVNNGVVRLGGTVDLYQYKAEADDKAHHVKGVTGVDNEIQVEGKQVSDQELEQQLGKKLAYDRAGWPDAAFNHITFTVSNGIVTLGGNTVVPWAKDSAISLVKNTPGVTDVIDNISVDPTSPMDNQTRIAVYRAVYGQAALNKYVMDPAKPIRITVVNGNVWLNGVVDSKMDKDIAGIQANQVPGVFKVTNDLVVANQKSEHN
jgi:osmotically-inducible protein OsmY